MKGIVIKNTGSWYVVRLENGTNINCRIKGKFRLNEFKATNPLAVGDKVVCEQEKGLETAIITELAPRENYIVRKAPHAKQKYQVIAANLDQAFLIVTLKKPKTSEGFINRFLITIEAYHIPTVLIFNKLDIYTREEMKEIEAISKIYQNIGYTTYLLSAMTGYNLDLVISNMKNKITLLSGHSGVGKSTFINAICPQLNIKTSKISSHTGKGVHTTSYIEMFELPFGGWMTDTPGIKEFAIVDLKAKEIAQYFPEMKKRLNQCQFTNCLHLDEPNCAIKEAVEKGEIHSSRYSSYIKITKDIIKDQQF